jgi:6-phosphogluconolactonase
MFNQNNDDKPEKMVAYVGSWGKDSPDEKSSRSGGGGIHIYALNPQDGSLAEIDHVAPQVNTGMICISPNQRHLYCTDERKNWEGSQRGGGGVHAFEIEPESGSLRYIDGTASMGVYPCHIAVDARGTYVFVCNHGEPHEGVTKVVVDEDGIYQVKMGYDDGVVAVYPVRVDGGIGRVCDVKVLMGNSTDVIEQASAHPHSVNIDFENKFAIVCDKGSDRIITYRINHASGTLELASALDAVPGSGPRHLAFHPSLPYFFTSNEINSTISSYEYDPQTGEVSFIQEAATLPKDHKADGAHNYPADVQMHPSGRFVCVSNRGHDSIAMYEIDPRTASLTPISFTSTRGNFPRALAFDPAGKFLFAANQYSGNIVCFAVDQKSGVLSPRDSTIKVPSPVCIKFVKFPS